MSNQEKMPSYRPWGSTEDGQIEFESLTSDTLEGALDLLRDSFYPDENIARGSEVALDNDAVEELNKLAIDAARDGVSVVAIDISSGQVVGVAFNKIQVQSKPNEKSAFEIFSENCKYKSSKALVDFMSEVDSKIDLFKHYNANCLLEIMFLGVLRSHRRRRIAELLVSASIEIGKQLKNGQSVKTPVVINNDSSISNFNSIPNIVSAIMTSNYSQKIAEKLGFDSLVEVKYIDYIYHDKTYQERIGDTHHTSRLFAKRL
ncbi:uncharacterized protein LOC122858719 isoform X1 [Aphidius gifuensis]|uniref:uncharacterized protein LOC122858719 isoform X1 n=2 Tax=Aphidius gifuensis TaxID=684658 RepID=UPI001CDCE2F5|nr:uncharacterized protein LOC122858719 isoform X1 [Aphidius gifuensis]